MKLTNNLRNIYQTYTLYTRLSESKHLIRQEGNGPIRFYIRKSFNWLSVVKKLVLCNYTDIMAELQSPEDDFNPPEAVRGMKVLERDAFHRKVKIPGITVPKKNTRRLTKSLKQELFRMKRMSNIVSLESTDQLFKTHNVVLLNPSKIKTSSDFNQFEMEVLKENDVLTDSFKYYSYELRYENWGFPDIMQAVLPKDSSGLSGYAVIGHIAHFNIKEVNMEYKNLIGQVMLDKVKNITTVVNKLNMIDNTFRNFQMELLAGEPNYITTVKENGCSFELDFSKVYWNPKLGTEHERVVNQVQEGDVVYDVFAGVGPFAVPCGKKNAIVFANDLNPSSYESLKTNVKSNKADKNDNVSCFNMDGRSFIKEVAFPDMLKRWSDPDFTGSIHVVMNLPALAVEFLDSFVGLLEENSNRDISLPIVQSTEIGLPIIHCYYFEVKEGPEGNIRDKIEGILSCSLPSDCEVRFVRNVSSGKNMNCIKFQLPKEAMYKKKKSAEVTSSEDISILQSGEADDKPENGSDKEPTSKKICMEPE